MATILAQTLVNDVRNDSDLNNSQVVTDGEICGMISDAGSDLRDIFSQTNQKYDISTFDFSLSGGLGDTAGVNSIDLAVTPGDFQQGHSVDVNPNTAQPYTLRYLTNWLDRNKVTSQSNFFGPASSPKQYYFLGTKLIVLPQQNAAGSYRLYYTPTWKPLALPSAVTVGTATVPIVVDGSTTGMSSSAFLNAPSGSFIAADVGDFVTITGATNPGNNGSFTIVAFTNSSQVTLFGFHTPETFPITATVTLSRLSSVTAGGLWTFYGVSQFTQTTGAINVGDTINVSGASHAGNNGSFVVTAVPAGGNTVTTAATGLVAENFATGTVTVTVQAAGTRPDLPAIMNPWILYLKTIACITIRNKRGQEVDAFERRLAIQKQRIEVILEERQEEPQQPPLTRGGDWSGGGSWGGSW